MINASKKVFNMAGANRFLMAKVKLAKEGKYFSYAALSE
jgi:hypothetical protein